VTAFVPARPSSTPFLPPQNSLRAISLRGLILLAELVFVLFALTNSPILGGGWAPYLDDYFFYIALFAVAIVIEGSVVAVPDRRRFARPSRRAKFAIPEDERPGWTTKFAFNFGIILFLGTVAVALAFTFLHVATTVVSGQARITGIVYILLFVAPVEEFMFRVVLPERIGWLLGSVILFALFHLGTYTAMGGGLTTSVLFNLAEAAVFGFLLFALYDLKNAKGERRVGYGGIVPIHALWDLVQLSFLGGFSLTLVSGGHIPL
jgi:hypothetical protein